MTKSTWRLYIACTSCHFVAASVPVEDAAHAEFGIPPVCPRCEEKKNAKKPNRLAIYREVLKARRQLRKANLEIWEP